MIILEQQDRTLSGKFGRAHKLMLEPDDFPPDSNYWKYDAIQAKAELEQLIGIANYNLWSEIKWPGDDINFHTFKELAHDFRAALAIGKDALLDDLECNCSRDPEDCCSACAAQARINARVEELM